MAYFYKGKIRFSPPQTIVMSAPQNAANEKVGREKEQTVSGEVSTKSELPKVKIAIN